MGGGHGGGNTGMAWTVSIAIIIALAVGTIVYELTNWSVFLFFILVTIGVLTFNGVLSLANADGNASVSRTEMQNAIAASVLLFYLSTIALMICEESLLANGKTSLSETDLVLVKDVVDHLTWLTGVVIGFYFGDKALEKIRDRGSMIKVYKD